MKGCVANESEHIHMRYFWPDFGVRRIDNLEDFEERRIENLGSSRLPINDKTYL